MEIDDIHCDGEFDEFDEFENDDYAEIYSYAENYDDDYREFGDEVPEYGNG